MISECPEDSQTCGRPYFRAKRSQGPPVEDGVGAEGARPEDGLPRGHADKTSRE